MLSAYGLTEPENRNAPIIAAGAGFVLLTLNRVKGRVEGFSAHPILGWRLCHGGESPLPITFSCDAQYCLMHDWAVEAPGGKVTSFEGCSYPNAAVWLRDMRRVLRGVS